MKKIVSSLIALCICFTLYVPHVFGLFTYSVKEVLPDGSFTTLLETYSLTEVRKYYANVDTNKNYALFQDDTIVSVKYGIVVFKRGQGCGYNVQYTNAITNNSGYTNGCYGVDALFLDTDSEYMKFKFMQSNAIGWAKRDDITILPIEAASSVTSYKVENNHLYHQIKTNMDMDGYAAMIDLGEAPSYLEEGIIYYSYDGKYFYTSFYDMRNDVIIYSHEHAVNKEPYYNYYQYVTNRTLTNYTAQEISSYLENNLLINSRIREYLDNNDDYISEILNESQLYGSIDSFIQNQYEYGVNALLMLAVAMNETATGKSALSYTRNNMFGHNAYDNNVEANASRYMSIASSITYHAKVFISNNYSNPKKFQYHGSFLGDKGSGMNVSYASDPYWGEKAAQYYMRLDEALGKKDYNSYALGIKSTATSIPIYAMPSVYSPVLYYSGKNWDYSFILLDKVTKDGIVFYQVQIDPAIDEYRESNNVYYYDYQKNIGYVKASDINYVLNEESIKTQDYETRTYTSGDGTFANNRDTIVVTVRSGEAFEMEHPFLKDHIFDSWEQKGLYYSPIYKKVSAAWISGDYQQSYYVNQSLNLNNTYLDLLFEDGSKKQIQVTSDMVSQIRLLEEGSFEIKVSFEGVSASFTVFAKERDLSSTDTIIETLEDFLETHQKLDSTAPTLINLLDSAKAHDIQLSFDEIRSADELLKQYYKDVEVVITDDLLDTQISGLYSVFQALDITESFIPENLFIRVQPVDTQINTNLQTIIEGNAWHYYNSFDIQMMLDNDSVEVNEDYILSIKTMDDSTNKYYIIVAYDEKTNNYYRLYGKQTASRIVFNTKGYTTFGIGYLTTTSSYNNPDIDEVYTIQNNGFNVKKRFITTLIIFIACALLLILVIVVYLFQSKDKKKRHHKKTHFIPKKNSELSSDIIIDTTFKEAEQTTQEKLSKQVKDIMREDENNKF